MSVTEKKPKNKVVSVIITVLTVAVFALALGIVINMVVCRVQKRPVSFFGTSFAIVQSASMEPYIMTGDLIVFYSCNYEDVEVGDYVVFVAGSGFGQLQGQNIVHEVKKITEDGIVTQGKNAATNPSPDKDLVTKDNLLGVCTGNSAAWGKIFTFLTKFGIIILIAVVAVPFIIAQVVKIIKLSKQKEEGLEATTEGDGSGTEGDSLTSADADSDVSCGSSCDERDVNESGVQTDSEPHKNPCDASADINVDKSDEIIPPDNEQ